MYAAQRFEVSTVIVSVTYKNSDLYYILHLPTCRLDYRLKIVQNLSILGYQVSWRDYSTLCVAGRLTAQEKQAPACHENTRAETRRPVPYLLHAVVSIQLPYPLPSNLLS